MRSTKLPYESDYDRRRGETIESRLCMNTKSRWSENHEHRAHAIPYRTPESSKGSSVRVAYQGKRPLTLKDNHGVRPNRGSPPHGQDLTSDQRRILECLRMMRRKAANYQVSFSRTIKFASPVTKGSTASFSNLGRFALSTKPLPALPITADPAPVLAKAPARIEGPHETEQQNILVKPKKPYNQANFPHKSIRPLQRNMQPLLPSPVPPHLVKMQQTSVSAIYEQSHEDSAIAPDHNQDTNTSVGNLSADFSGAAQRQTDLSSNASHSRISTREDKIRARKLRDKHRAKNSNGPYSVNSSPEQSFELNWTADKLDDEDLDRDLIPLKTASKLSAATYSTKLKTRRSPRRLSRLTTRDWGSHATRLEDDGVEDTLHRFSTQPTCDVYENDKRKTVIASAAKRNSSTSPVDFAAAHPPPSQPAPPPPPPPSQGPKLSCNEERLSSALIELSTHQRPNTTEKAVRWYSLNGEPPLKIEDLRSFMPDSSSLPKQSQPLKGPDLKTSTGTECVTVTSRAQLMSRLNFLERQNRLLENALLAVLRTGGKMNGCICSAVERNGHHEPRSSGTDGKTERDELMAKTRPLSDSLATPNEHEKGSNQGQPTFAAAPDLHSDEDTMGTSALDLYMATRTGEGNGGLAMSGAIAATGVHALDTEHIPLSDYDFDSEDTTEDPTNGKKASEEGEELILGFAV